MRIAAIHQPQYLPYLGFFHKLLHCDVFVALDNVQFQKNGLQNRNRIKSSRGWQWITVPVLHRYGQLINQVLINSQIRWAKKHWNALVSNYARAPHFDTCAHELKDVLDRECSRLCDLNMVLIRWVADFLGIKTPILYASAMEVDGNQTELLVNICQAAEADCYLSGPGGKRYMDLTAFKAADIAVIWQEFTTPVYDQLFPDVGFLPDMSIVDALFNHGPGAIEFLRRGPKEREV